MGSGKSYVCRIAEEAGYPVYWADRRAKELMTVNPTLRAHISDAFGPESYLPDGTLNRGHLAATVFPNPQQLQRLNNLVHPAVATDYFVWCSQLERAGVLAVFKETAILFEAKLEHQTDEVWLVYAPKELRIGRILSRDGISRQQALERMERQWTDHTKMQLAHRLIFNDDRHDVEPQVMHFLSCITRS
jgi:dephospho-CoA kinase